MIPLSEKVLDAIKGSVSLSERAFSNYISKSNNSADMLGVMLVNDGIISRSYIGKLIADNISVAYIELSTTSFQTKLFSIIPNELFLQFNCIPIYTIAGTITLACSDPLNENYAKVLKQKLNNSVNLIYSFSDEIQFHLYKNNASALLSDNSQLRSIESDSETSCQIDLYRSLSNYLIARPSRQ